MIIINRKSIPEAHVKEIHHLSARKELESEYKWRERVLSGEKVQNPETLGGGSYRPLDRVQDVQAMRKQMKTYKKNFERGAPEKLSSAMRDYLWKKAKVLKDKFVVGMVPQRELHPIGLRNVSKQGNMVVANVADYDKMNNSKVIERQAAWDKKNKDTVNEFKNIMRQLEPDNPNIANVERFRP